MAKSFLMASILAVMLPSLPARAGGCYVCAEGSAPSCRDYCQYEGADTFDSRHRCKARGCRVAGTAPCPGPDRNVKVCVAPGSAEGAIAAIPWCAPVSAPGAA